MSFLPEGSSGSQKEMASPSCSRHIILQADHLSRGVGVAVLAPANVDLVLRGLLVDWVVKVYAVNVPQPPVPPQEDGPEDKEGHQCNGEEDGQEPHTVPLYLVPSASHVT